MIRTLLSTNPVYSQDIVRSQQHKIHKIGYCANCGWVHSKIIRRVRTTEYNEQEKVAVIMPLCVDCIKEIDHQVMCNLCGRTKCDNLYPVSIIRKRGENGFTCKLFLHLCATCRKLPHEEVLYRLNLPEGLCDNCKDRFTCFTNKTFPPPPSQKVFGILQGEKTSFHKEDEAWHMYSRMSPK